jgi:hypothetical protein
LKQRLSLESLRCKASDGSFTNQLLNCFTVELSLKNLLITTAI